MPKQAILLCASAIVLIGCGEPSTSDITRDASALDSTSPGHDAGLPPLPANDGGSPPMGDGGPAPDGGSVGLEFPDGIEPGDPSVCEAPSGQRCWWVDADAPEGGDGSYASPFNSFETVVGYTDWSTPGGAYVQGRIQGGDVLYLRGRFRASLHDEVRNNLTIEMIRASQGGTREQPTTIKSWLGSPRAIFDGEYVRLPNRGADDLGPSDLIIIRQSGGIRIQNIEVTRARSRGILISEGVAWAEVSNVVVHDTLGDNFIGTGGGILFSMVDTLHDFVLHHSVFHSNWQMYERGTGDENVGGVGILSESGASDGSVIELHHNVIYDEVRAIRHKHNGNVLMRAHDNLIYDSMTAFYMRSFFNEVHHNVILDVEEAFNSAEQQSAQGNAETWIFHNTVVGARSFLVASGDDDRYARVLHVHDNVLTSSESVEPAIDLGRWNNENVSIAGWSFGNNLYFYALPDSTFLYHRPAGATEGLVHAGVETAFPYLGDSSSRFADPMLDANHAPTPGSPAIGAASDGANIGAF